MEIKTHKKMNVIIKFNDSDLAILKTLLLAEGDLSFEEINKCVEETTKKDITLDFDLLGKDALKIKVAVLALAISQTQHKK